MILHDICNACPGCTDDYPTRNPACELVKLTVDRSLENESPEEKIPYEDKY
jgi:hypothetical protein